MKQFIALSAAILLLIAFPLQMMLEIRNFHKIDRLQAIANNYSQLARKEGTFTQEILDAMKAEMIDANLVDPGQDDWFEWSVPGIPAKIAFDLDYFDPDDLIVYKTPTFESGSTQPEGTICYTFKNIKFNRLVVASMFFWIEDDGMDFSVSGCVVSEVIRERGLD